MGVVVFQLLVLIFQSILCGFGTAKECTNVPSPLSSHVHYHLTPTDDSVWSGLHPRKMLSKQHEFDWAMIYKKMKSPIQSSGNFLKEVSLHNVRLGSNSFHWRAQQTNLEYLLMLDVDRLVWSFRKTAGLPTPGKAYGGWEAADKELRGHFVGHYLSATAQMWASTHNETLRRKMSAVVSALSACQEKIGSGYLSAFPSEFFDRHEAIEYVWAPYYTIHKVLAGLLDQYTLANNAQAFKMLKWMVDYFYNRVKNVITKYSVERHYLSLNNEFGGMNDLLYKLFSITKDPKHIVLAHLFDKPCFLGLLALQADDISDFHSNTHIPIVIGSQMRYEITGDPLYKQMGTFFFDIVNSSYTYATGGTSVNEHWSDPKRLATTLNDRNEESCTTYNMLKVSRHLFRWTKEAAYADYYERALTNGVLGVQRGTEPGVMIYLLPLAPGSSKNRTIHHWGTPYDSFWCCYGTGVESFSKLGDSIYFEEESQVPGLYVIQYISSSLNWKLGQIILDQKVDPVVSWDPYLRVTYTFNQAANKSSTLNLRIPIWTRSEEAKATLNGRYLTVPPPGNFLSLTRRWNCSDKLSIQLPINLRTEAIQDDRPEYASLQAILYGPYLLAGYSSGDWDIKSGSAKSLSDWITPVPAIYNRHLVSFSQNSGDSVFVLTNSNESLTMEKFPKSGTDESIHGTFRLILGDSSSVSELSKAEDAIGKVVMLEPFDLPGMLLAHQGEDVSLSVANKDDDDLFSIFRLVPGLDGKKGSVSLESASHENCFVFSGGHCKKSGTTPKLRCKKSSEAEFSRGASFVMNKGISHYHPISFVAKGGKRNFLLSPLFNFRDESYTTYFIIQE